MTNRKLAILFASTLCLIGASYFIRNMTSVSSAPASVSIPIEGPIAVPGMKTTNELIAYWQQRVERDPHDYISLGYLGQTFMRRGRETGDLADYEKAQAALNQALQLNPDYEPTMAFLGAVQYAKHDFATALKLASRVYSSDPRALQALATIGDAQMELGNYAQAETAFDTLMDRAPGPAVYARLSRLNWLKGRPEEALQWMQRAVDEAQKSEYTGEEAAWYQLQLGELYFNTGRVEEAERHYTAAVHLFDHYYLALAGLGKIRAAQSRYDEAIAYYEQAVAIIPQPDFLAALGDLHSVTGQPDKAQRQYDTVEFIGKLAAINQVVYNRQLAVFEANHDLKVQEALDLAARELAIRKDVYGYDTQAWALYKNGRYQEAAEAMTQAMKLGTRDALLYYHAGMIYKALGNPERAQAMLKEAMSINPHFDLLQARIARAALEQLASE
jgi:tetratricopeptide (TPR) repeat protein